MTHISPPRWLLAVLAVLIVVGLLYAVSSIGVLPEPSANVRPPVNTSSVRKPTNRPPRKPEAQEERSATDIVGWCCIRDTYTCKKGMNPRSCKDEGGMLFSPLESHCVRLCKP